jgi:hypothetical protein
MNPAVVALIPTLFHLIGGIFQHHPGPVPAKVEAATAVSKGLLSTVLDDVEKYAPVIESWVTGFAKFARDMGGAEAAAPGPAAVPSVRE